jgi:uncharacterized BrkB/YihY/UPF0761 family membrane protein
LQAVAKCAEKSAGSILAFLFFFDSISISIQLTATTELLVFKNAIVEYYYFSPNRMKLPNRQVLLIAAIALIGVIAIATRFKTTQEYLNQGFSILYCSTR